MEKTPVSVYQAADVSEAHLVSGLLLEEGIDAKVLGEGQPFAGLLAAMSVDVIVPHKDQLRAFAIVARYLEGRNAEAEMLNWNCPSCAEAVPASFEICFQCGTERPVNPEPAKVSREMLTATSATVFPPEREPSHQATDQLQSQSVPAGIVFETAVVLSLMVPFYYVAVAAWVWPEKYLVFEWDIDSAMWSIARDSPIIGVILYLMWRSEKAWSDFGLVRPQVSLDVPLTGCIVLVDFILWHLFSTESLSETSPMLKSPVGPLGIFGHALVMISLCISAFMEELMLRGYLIPRFEQIFKSTATSVFLTALIFTGYHLNDGPAGLLSAGLGGVVYGISFCLIRRIWPIATAHAIFNMVSYWQTQAF